MDHAAVTASRVLSSEAAPVPWPADVERVFRTLSRHRGCFWLDSAGGPAALARWSVMSAEPSSVVSWEEARAVPWRATLCRGSTGHDATERVPPANPFSLLRGALRSTEIEDGGAAAPPFGPGFYGYLSYDLAPHVESTASLAARRDMPMPELWFGLYDAVLVLDHLRREAYLAGGAGPSREAIAEALAAVATGGLSDSAGPELRSGLTCNFSRAAYLEAVDQARRYIAAGDIYQVNLSRRFTAAMAGDPGSALPSLYRRLRCANPAPYAAYFDLGQGRAVLSSSPELFLDLAGGRVVTRPVKGTRPLRPGDPAFNDRMRRELLASAKDAAELVMIVDLERNDLGRVCSYGTVRVTEPRAVEPYAAVQHTVAAVEGRLHDGRDVVDLLRATFPGGSITGAPKVRAMQIIAELEPTRRSVYTGAVGYLRPPSAAEPAGRCSLNVAIRTLLVAWPDVHLAVGGGIVADSDPAAEFDETTDKARAMLAALGLAI
jgi:para-aminobenzoate synthetase component I